MMKKKILSLALAFVMVFTMVACGSSSDSKPSDSDNSTTKGDEPSYVTSPITIDFWHTFGSGTQAEYMTDAVKRFNETNEYGITVNATYIGGYSTLRSQLTTSIGAGDNPQIAVLGMSDILASAGVLADMTPYVERDQVDVDSYIDGVQTSMYYEEQLTALPFIRSCPLFYYNVDMFAAAGYNEAPKTIEEMKAACKAVAQKNGVYGMQYLIDPNFQQEAIIRSLGSEGIINADNSGADCLDDGTMLQLLADWKAWVDEGWCAAPSVTDATNGMYQMMYSGELAACVASSASLTTIVDYAKDNGQNIAVAQVPGYNGACGVGGGGDISIIAANSDEQQKAAAWEFVKFLMTDEEVAIRSEATGYLPTSQAAADLMSDLFAENPNMQIAYEARKACEDVPGCTQRAEWQTQVSAAISYVIQDKSKSPKEAIDYLKSMLPTVFY